MSSTTPSPQEAFIHGQLINLVRTGQAVTRPALEQETGIGRKVVDPARPAGDRRRPAGGRRPRPVRPVGGRPGSCGSAPRPGTSSPGLIGATEMTAAVATLDGTLVASLHEDWDAADRPEETLELLDGLFVRLARKTRTEPWAFGIGVAGPVDFAHRPAGRPADHAGLGRLQRACLAAGSGTTRRSGWTTTSTSWRWASGTRVSRRTGATCCTSSSTRVWARAWCREGTVFRGDTGAAGDIGHIQVTDDPAVICRCGQIGLPGRGDGRVGPGPQADPAGGREPRPVRAPGPARPPDRPGRRPGGPGRRPARLGGGRCAAPGSSARPWRTSSTSSTRAPSSSAAAPSGSGTRSCVLFEETVRARTTKLAAQRLTVRPASLDFREGVTGAAILAIEQLFGAGVRRPLDRERVARRATPRRSSARLPCEG